MFIHPLSDVHSSITVMPGTRIWQYAVILENAKIGSNCNICAHTFIEGGVVVGSNVTIKSGVYLWEGVHIEDDVFLGPNATFTNDSFPRSKKHPATYPITLIKKAASIGANATILPGLVIGAGAMIGAGAVVTHDVPDHAVVTGNPARIIRYLDDIS